MAKEDEGEEAEWHVGSGGNRENRRGETGMATGGNDWLGRSELICQNQVEAGRAGPGQRGRAQNKRIHLSVRALVVGRRR